MKWNAPERLSSLAPTRVSRLPVLALVLGVCGVLAIHFDTTLIAIADSTHLRGDVGRMVDLAECFAFGPAALVIALGVVLADQRSKWFTARLFTYPILAGVAANVAKLALPRLRPRGLGDLANVLDVAPSGWDTFAIASSNAAFRRLGDGSSNVWQSFPSGHSATAIGLAIGLSRLYPQARWYFFSLALFSGLQRVMSKAHYPSDVLAGAALAMVVCWALERKSSWSLAINGKPNEAKSVAVLSISKAA